MAPSDDGAPDSAPEESSDNKEQQKDPSGGGERKERIWWKWFPPYRKAERWRKFWRAYLNVWAVAAILGIVLSFPSVRSPAYFLFASLNDQGPSLNVYDYCPVYTTTEKPVFLANVTGVTTLTYQLYPKSALTEDSGRDGSDHTDFLPDQKILNDDLQKHHLDQRIKGTPIIEKTNTVTVLDMRTAGVEIDLPALSAGDYFLKTLVQGRNGKSVETIDFFRVTNLGLIVKSDPDKAVFQAIDLRTRKPRTDVQINLFTQQNLSNPCALSQLGSARTDSTGFATISRESRVSYWQWSGLVVDAVQGKERAYCGPYFSQTAYFRQGTGFYEQTTYQASIQRSDKTFKYWSDNIKTRQYEEQRIFLMTDRPVYRLGQRVFYSGVLMVYGTDGIANRGRGQTVQVTFQNGLEHKVIATDANGRFSGFFDIPLKAQTGTYFIRVSPPNSWGQSFPVAVMQYRRPEYQVIIKPSAPHVVQGTRPKATIKAQYYFGAPVTNANIRYEISPYIDVYKRRQIGDAVGLAENSYRGQYSAWDLTLPQTVTGTAITDKNGDAEIDLPTAMPTTNSPGPGSYGYGDINYSIKAQATDSSRMTVQAMGDLLVTRGNFGVLVNPSTIIAKAGDKFTAAIKVFSYDKAPLSAKHVKVRLCRWDPKKLSPWQQLRLWLDDFKPGQPPSQPMTEVSVLQQETTTKSDGTADVIMTIPKDLISSDYYVVAECEDDSHHQVGDVAELRIDGEGEWLGRDDDKPVSVQLNQSQYEPSTVAKALLHLPLKKDEEATALLSIEGRKLYDIKMVQFKGPSKIVEIPVDPQYVPNAFVCLTFIDKHHLAESCSQMLCVSHSQNRLKLNLTADGTTYKPGGTAHYQVEVRDSNNRPAKNAAIVLSVIDQSVNDIANNVPSTDQSFHEGIKGNPASALEATIYDNHFYNWVETDFSFGPAYTGKLNAPATFDGAGLPLAIVPVIFPAAPLLVPVCLTMMVTSRMSERQDLQQQAYLECKMSPQQAMGPVGPELASAPGKILRMEGIPGGARDGAQARAGTNLPPNRASRSSSSLQGFVPSPSKRTNFKELASWLPALVTDANGIASAEIKLPDDLTTWDATAYGVEGTHVGSAELMVNTSSPLIARLALPRFYTEGDSGYITSILNNTSNVRQAVKLTLDVPKEFSTTEPLTKIVAVGPKGSIRFSWPVHVTQSGSARISLTAQGTEYGDALERILPIDPFGYTAFFMRSGVLTDATAQKKFPINLPDNAKLATGKFQLSLSSSSIGPVLGNFGKLIDYPYECTEQTMSRLEPFIVARNLNTFGAPLSHDDNVKFRQVYDFSMPKLLDYQHSDGGWGWWKDDDSSPYLSALVMEGFYRLTRLGYPVDSGVHYRALAYLKTQSDQLLLKSWSRDEAITHAKIVYVLSLFGEHPSTSSTLWHMANVDSMSPEELSYMTLAFKKVGDDHNTKIALARLLALRNDTDEHTDWDHTDALYAKLGMKEHWSYTYRFTGVESTALALRAVAAADPGNTELIERVTKWILAQRDENGWVNTKTTAEVFEALLEKELAVTGGKKPDFKATVSTGQELLKSYAFSKLIEPGERTADLGLVNRPKEVVLSKNGSGRLYYSSLLQYERPLKNDDELIAKSSPTDMRIKRSLFQLKQIGVTHENKPLYDKIPLKGQTLKAGDLILMQVSIHTPLSVPYVMVEAPLPSGAETADDVLVRVKKVDSHGKEYDTNESTASLGSYGSHADTLDDRMAFFFTSLSAGDLSFAKVLRMEMPGHFNVNPVTLQAMYTTGIRGYSGVDAISVSE